MVLCPRKMVRSLVKPTHCWTNTIMCSAMNAEELGIDLLGCEQGAPCNTHFSVKKQVYQRPNMAPSPHKCRSTCIQKEGASRTVWPLVGKRRPLVFPCTCREVGEKGSLAMLPRAEEPLSLSPSEPFCNRRDAIWNIAYKPSGIPRM